jgi:hypothetical protein
MKKLASIFLLLLTILSGCETERILFKGPYHVRFTESSLTTKESNTQLISIEVHLVSPALDEDITIFYTINGSARENIDYTILETRGSLVIKKGEYVGVIDVQLINNANNIIRSQELLLTLTSTTNNVIQVGQSEGGIGKQFSLTIVDDCILGGEYIGTRSGASAPVSITSDDCEKYVLSNWNINLFSTSTPMDLTFVDNGDNTLTIPEQEEQNIDDELATIKGTGVVDPLTGTIIMNITLVDFENQPTVTLTYNRN